MPSNIVYVGVKGHVAALDKRDGRTLWQTKLKGGLTSGDRFVTLLVEDGRVYAHTCGEVFCLRGDTGEILWQNGLVGLSYDIASLAIEGVSSPSTAAFADHRRKESAAGADAGNTAGSH